jgi:hypothetical protein
MANKKPINRTRTTIRTLSGTVDDTNGTRVEILLDDGNINSTHELLEWKIWPVAQVVPFHAYLQGSTVPAISTNVNRAEINNQYAWTGYAPDNFGTAYHHYEVTNDGSLIVDNLYINIIGTGTGAKFNYRLRLRETVSSDNQAILGMLKQHSQDMNDE